MERPPSRRGFLRAATAIVGGSIGLSGHSLGARIRRQSEAFDPAVHGFGFRNWSSREREIHQHRTPEPKTVRSRLRTGWQRHGRAVLGVNTSSIPRKLIRTIATQLRHVVTHLAGSNGHCYGMVLSAQRYFERPETIPVDRLRASEIEDPRVPIDDPSVPVFDEIVQRQADQLLRFRSWVGRASVLRPKRIDTAAVVRDVEAAVRRFGTASVLIFDESLLGHQLLVHEVERASNEVRLAVYDPNYRATAYPDPNRVLRFDRRGDRLSMEPYLDYPYILYNRYDQIARATGRTAPSPLDHLRAGPSTLRRSLLPYGLVLVDSSDVDLTVVDPDGALVRRLRGRYDDRTRGEYARMRPLYGIDPGNYRFVLLGSSETEYELRSVAAGMDGERIDETRSGSLGAGEVHEYEFTVPESGDWTLHRPGGGRRYPRWLAGGVGVAGGAAVGAMGYRALQRRTQ